MRFLFLGSCFFFADKFGPAMTLVKSDIGGNISVKFISSSLGDLGNGESQIHV